jgi:DNA-binding response OmpR family regulator
VKKASIQQHDWMISPMRILVIEDNRDILANVLDYLQLKGYSVDCAQDGLSGLHLATTVHYDLIVLDIMLRHGRLSAV